MIHNQEDTLNILFDGLASTLLARLQSGDIKPSELNVIRQFLKDNNIQCKPTMENPLGNLVASLPFEVDLEDL